MISQEMPYFAICKNCWLTFEGQTRNGVVPKSKDKEIRDHFKSCDKYYESEEVTNADN